MKPSLTAHQPYLHLDKATFTGFSRSPLPYILAYIIVWLLSFAAINRKLLSVHACNRYFITLTFELICFLTSSQGKEGDCHLFCDTDKWRLRAGIIGFSEPSSKISLSSGDRVRLEFSASRVCLHGSMMPILWLPCNGRADLGPQL